MREDWPDVVRCFSFYSERKKKKKKWVAWMGREWLVGLVAGLRISDTPFSFSGFGDAGCRSPFSLAVWVVSYPLSGTAQLSR